jgi:hypothetical protein
MTIHAEPKPTRRRADGAAGTVDTAPPEVSRPKPSRSRTPAAQRAYARRAQREGRKVQRPIDHDHDHDNTSGRAAFVVLIIALLTVGVAATLWLSTQAIADSYRLEDAKQEADHLAERAAELQREVTEKESASSLAERAKAMGMVPAGDPARLIVQPDGTVVVVGEPKPVEKPAPPTPPADDEAPTGDAPTGDQPSGDQPAGDQQGGTG